MRLNIEQTRIDAEHLLNSDDLAIKTVKAQDKKIVESLEQMIALLDAYHVLIKLPSTTENLNLCIAVLKCARGDI